MSGTGFWVNDPQNAQQFPNWFPASITWNVTYNQSGYWHYNYVLSVYRAEVSHFILETSPNFTANDIFGATGAFASYGIGTHPQNSPGNPFMPADVYGIKFDNTTGTTLTLDFNSYRAPVWGDFYAKCGAVGGTQNTVWNNGFTAADPTAPAADGSLDFHILVPDTEVVPEPSGFLALGSGLIGLVGFIRRKR